MPNESLINRTKQWIARSQAETLRQHDARAESVQTPLTELIKDIQIDPKKHIQRLKTSVLSGMVIAGSLGSFNPNALSQNESLNTYKLNTELINTESESKSVKEFVNQVFGEGGKFSSMKNGGTPLAIKHSIEKDGDITRENAPQIIMEAIKINNGATNPINLQHYKTQIAMYNHNLELGYTPTQALIQSRIESANQNPKETNSPKNDLELMAKIDFKSPKETENKLKEQYPIPSIAPEIKPSTIPTSVAPETPTKEVFGPFVNPAVPPNTNQSPEKSPEIKDINQPPTDERGWFDDINRKAIEDTLKQLGIILAVGGAATLAGVTTTKALYRQYQSWESSLPTLSNEEIRRIFWTNINKIKQEYQINNVPEEIISTDVHQINIDLLRNRTPFTKVEPVKTKPIIPAPTVIVREPKASWKEKIQTTWSRAIKGLRSLISKPAQISNGISNRVKEKTKQIVEPIQQFNTDNELIRQTRQREQAVIEDMKQYSVKKEATKQAQTSKLTFELRSIYNQSLLNVQSEYEQGRETIIIKTKEYHDNLKEEKDFDRVIREWMKQRERMDNFEIPFDLEYYNRYEIDPTDKFFVKNPKLSNEQLGTIEMNLSMNHFSNHDLEAAVILIEQQMQSDKYKRGEDLYGTPYYFMALKAYKIINSHREKYGVNRLFRKVKGDRQFQYPEYLADTECFPRSTNNQLIRSEFDSVRSTKKSIALLQWEQKQFESNSKLANAFEAAIQHELGRENLYLTRTKITNEQDRRSSRKNIENVNGKAEEYTEWYFDVLNDFDIVFDDFKYCVKREAPQLYDKFYAIYLEICSTLGKYAYIRDEFIDMQIYLGEKKDFELSIVNVDLLNQKLIKMLEFIRKNSLLKKLDENHKHRNRPYDTSTYLEWLIELNIRVIDALKLPPNHKNSIDDVFTVDNECSWYGGEWKKYATDYKLVKYKTSEMFPGVLEAVDEEAHYWALFKGPNVPFSASGVNISSAKRAFETPHLASKEDFEHLKQMKAVLADPANKYRKFRVETEDSKTRSVSIEELFLPSSSNFKI